MKITYVRLAKIYTNRTCHMTKMATTTYVVKTLYISSTLEPKGQWLWDLVCSIVDVGPNGIAQMMNLC